MISMNKSLGLLHKSVENNITEMSTSKNKKSALSIGQKIEILNAVRNKTSRKELCKIYNCNNYTITRIIKNEEKIKNLELNGNLNRKRLRMGRHNEVNKAVSTWFHQMRYQNVLINGPMICEQAKKFARMLNVDDFEPTNGWLHRWKTNENVVFRKLNKDRKNANKNSCAYQLTVDILSNLIKDYPVHNVYNADETGLFYKALPRGKIQKSRLTLLFITNMDGSDKQVFAIGQFKNSRNETPIPYYSQRESSMTSNLWCKILKAFDERLDLENRKIILFVDNAACHKIENFNLKNIDIHFLPTSISQPLTQGIIRWFKVYYRNCLIRKQLLALESGQTLKDFLKSINVFEALKIIKKCWSLVSSIIIKNCFRKANFISENVDEIDENIHDSRSLGLSDEEFQYYVDCDENLEPYGSLSDEQIVDQVYPDCIINDDTEENEQFNQFKSETAIAPTRLQVLTAIKDIRMYFEHYNLKIDPVEEIENEILFQNKNLIEKNIYN